MSIVLAADQIFKLYSNICTGKSKCASVKVGVEKKGMGRREESLSKQEARGKCVLSNNVGVEPDMQVD